MNTETKDESLQDVQKPVWSHRKRMSLFLATYTLGALLVFFIGPPQQNLRAARADQGFLFLLGDFLILLAGTFVFLPMGAVLPFIAFDSGVAYPLQLLLSALSYILTPLLPLLGSSAERPRTFRRLYLIFLGLLVMNVAGCLANPVPIP